jgi:hypothetical protein
MTPQSSSDNSTSSNRNNRCPDCDESRPDHISICTICGATLLSRAVNINSMSTTTTNGTATRSTISTDRNIDEIRASNVEMRAHNVRVRSIYDELCVHLLLAEDGLEEIFENIRALEESSRLLQQQPAMAEAILTDVRALLYGLPRTEDHQYDATTLMLDLTPPGLLDPNEIQENPTAEALLRSIPRTVFQLDSNLFQQATLSVYNVEA